MRDLLFILTLWLAMPLSPAGAQSISRYYRIESVATPPEVSPHVGGVDFLPDGRAFVCFHEGAVYLFDPAAKSWKLFASGLHEPLGLIAVSPTEAIVSQRPELTRLLDTNGDGLADRYDPITDAYGMSGNYHEFNFGPARDSAGNIFFASSCASSGASPRYELRGGYNPDGRDLQQDYSPVPYRGWIWKVTPDGNATPYASGFRQPNGLGFDAEGRLFCTDNQGSFIGANKLLPVRPGRFHGMIMSRVWEKNWPGGNPLDWPIHKHDFDRVHEAIMFPYGQMSNSPTQPVAEKSGGKFGPFAGQMLIGEMNRPRIIRVQLENIGGQLQGMCVPFFDGDGLDMGVVRLAQAPDSSLWVGHTMRQGWAGATGFQRITWTGVTPPEVHSMHLAKNGFDLKFTVPLDAASASSPAAYQVQRYYYRYHRRYDPRQFELRSVGVKSVKLSEDRRTVSLELDAMVPGRVYEFNLKGVKAAEGSPIVNPMFSYTFNHTLDGNTGYQPRTILLEKLPATIPAGNFQENTGATVAGTSLRIPDAGATPGCWIHVPQAGKYQLAFQYTAEKDATIGFGVNGRGANSPRVFKAGRHAWLPILVTLDKGDNGVFFASQNKGSITLESMTVAPEP